MTWFTILGMAVITFINRYAFFSGGLKFKPSEKFLRFLSFSSYSILTAIWLPIIVSFEPSTGFSHAGMDYVIATVLAVVMAVCKVPNIIVVVVCTIIFFVLRLLVFS